MAKTRFPINKHSEAVAFQTKVNGVMTYRMRGKKITGYVITYVGQIKTKKVKK